jgi:uncharacterized membrane protein YdjX (TVP38/TMEM64 family)
LKKNSIVKSNYVSLLLRVILGLSVSVLILLIFYVYHEGAWREIINYYRYFLNHRKLEAYISSFGPFAAIMFVVIQAWQVVFAPIPGEVTGFVGGFLFGKVQGLILSTIGLTIGSMLAFGITRAFGMRFVEKVVKKEYINKFNFFVTHKGLYVSFIFFLIPGFPKDSLCYLLGLTHMRFIDFVLMNIFGRLPGTLILTLQGNAVRNGKYQTFFALLIVTVVLTIGLYITRNYIIGFFSKAVHLILRKKKNK